MNRRACKGLLLLSTLALARPAAPEPARRPAPEAEEVRAAAAIPLDALGNRRLAARGLVDITAPPFEADPTGARDSTAALQKAIFFARERQMAVYLPAGTYRVSDTLRCPHGNGDPSSGRLRGREWACVLLGSRSGPARPRVLLAPRSPGYADPEKPKYVVQFWSWAWTEGEGPPQHQDNINMNQMWVGIDLVVGEGNPGAVGIRCRGAQGTGIQDCTIDATHGLCGLAGGAGSGGGHYNVTILGGRIGADLRESQPAPTIAGFLLLGQSKHALLYDGRQTLTAVGCRIEMDGPGPAVVAGSERPWLPNGQVCLVDSSIAFRTPGENTACAGSSSLYLNNVYIKGARFLTSRTEQGAALNPDTWTCVKEAAYGRPPLAYPPKPKGGYGPFTYASPLYIDGARSTGDIADMTSKAPPPDLATRHVWGDNFPSWEQPDAAHVKDPPFGAVGDGKTDDAAAIQRAIDACDTVFLSKGRYAVSRTIRLKPRTRLLGLHPSLSWIEAKPGGDFDDATAPRPVVATADDRDAPTVLAFLGILAGADTPGAYALEWRAGRQSIYRAMDVKLVRWGRSAPTIDFPFVRVAGHGGGRWYNFFQESWKAQGPAYRHLLVEGTAEPLWIYQCNPEHSRSEANLEIRNARHVSLFGVKGEYEQPIVVVRDSDHIRLFGYGGNAAAKEGRALFVVKNTPNFLAANLIDSPRYPGDGSPEHFAGEGVDPRRWHMLREEPADGPPVLTQPLDRPVLVRRGRPREAP